MGEKLNKKFTRLCCCFFFFVIENLQKKFVENLFNFCVCFFFFLIEFQLIKIVRIFSVAFNSSRLFGFFFLIIYL